jgi:hypothetical protein
MVTRKRGRPTMANGTVPEGGNLAKRGWMSDGKD